MPTLSPAARVLADALAAGARVSDLKVKESRRGVDHVDTALAVNVTSTTAYRLPDHADVRNACSLFRDNGGTRIAVLDRVLIVGPRSYVLVGGRWFNFEVRNFKTSYEQIVGRTGSPSYQQCSSSTALLKAISDVATLGPPVACATGTCRTVTASFQTSTQTAGLRASRRATILISEQTGLIVRRTLETTWSDAGTLIETADFYDYGVPNKIEAPAGM